jgi:NAD(P)-dependent dehydrogenase (short-subunit alcohol dehydrogenase family)
MPDLNSRAPVVVVTGASAGVGRAAVRCFASHGYDVGLLARGSDGLDAAASEVKELGRRACAVRADVARWSDVERAAADIERELGPIDVWVNNAMTSVFATFMDVAPEEFARVTDVTYHGYMHGTRAALTHMLPRDRGVIVQVGSALAYRGIPAQAAYCGAKHAIQGFTESVRSELAHRKSRVAIAMVQLPAINTPQFDWVLSRFPRRPQPVPPIYQPELIASAIVSIAEHPRREMWLGASTIAAILANRIAPNAVMRYLAHTGIESQQTDEPALAARPANLWDPLSGDWGARGRFDARAHERSLTMWLSRNRTRAVRGAAASAALASVALLAARIAQR